MISINNKKAVSGFRKAAHITKNYAKTFYFASRFLGKPLRKASYAVYAICRISDDTVDVPGEDAGIEALLRMKEDVDRAYQDSLPEDPLLLAFSLTTKNYFIPKRLFSDLQQGIGMDLQKIRYATFQELYEYCYYVAGVVGLIMLHIFGYRRQYPEGSAINLGVAMQLTNILRDVYEDSGRGRIYLPEDEMSSFNVTDSHLLSQNIDAHFVSLMKYNINRARQYYREALSGIRYIKDIRSRFVVCLMKDMYAGILRAIEKNSYNVFAQRAHVSFPGKIMILLHTIVKGEYI